MIGIKRSRAILLCGGMAASFWSGAVSAQTGAQASDTPGLADIIVTAQRTETNLQNTPISITALSGETLAQRGSSSLLDVAAFTPNLSIANNGGAGTNQSSFAIRGMGVGGIDSSAAVGVYVDDVYSPSFFGNVLGLLDVARVEVLRGPQGTLFGRNTIAGAVQYVSVKPSSEPGGFVEGTLGNLDRRKIAGAINVPLGDTLAIRAAASYDNQGGYVTDDLNDIKRGRSRTTLGRLQLRWTPSDALTVSLKAEFGRQRNNGRAVAVLGVEPRAQFAGLASIFGETQPLTQDYVSMRKYHFAGFNSPDYFRSRMRTYQGIVSYALSDTVTLKSITAYTDNRNEGVFDFDLTSLQIFAFERGVFSDKVFTQELQLTGTSFADRLHWTAGLYYYDGRTTVRGTDIRVGTQFVLQPSDTRNTAKSIAGYGQATYDLTGTLSASAGLRYTREKVGGRDITLSQGQSGTFTDWSPHFGLNYQAADDMLFYAKVSKGFRAGGFTVNSALPGSALAYGPETAWTYELGARMEFLDRRLRVNPTIFYTDWKSIQFQRNVVTPTTVVGATQNAGDARIKGAELEMQFAATSRLMLTASASLLDSKYKRVDDFVLNSYPFGYLAFLGGVPGSLVQVTDLTTASPLQQSPDYKYALGARYTLPLANEARLITSVDWGYTDDIRIGVTDANSQTIKGYGILNGRIQYEMSGGRFAVALYATNLLNQYYLTGGDGKGKGFTIGTDQGDVGRPREYGVTLRASF